MATDLIMPTLPGHQGAEQQPQLQHAAAPVQHAKSQLFYAVSERERQPLAHHQRSVSASPSQFYSSSKQHPHHQSVTPSHPATSRTSPTGTPRGATTPTTHIAGSLPAPSTSAPSPSSPKSHHARQQARPLFMPAVLRPTEFPPKAPRYPGAKPAQDEDDKEDDARMLRRDSSSFLSLTGLAILGQRLSRRGTNDCNNKPATEVLDHDMFPQVNALPTRKHWKVRSFFTMAWYYIWHDPDAESSGHTRAHSMSRALLPISCHTSRPS